MYCNTRVQKRRVEMISQVQMMLYVVCYFYAGETQLESRNINNRLPLHLGEILHEFVILFFYYFCILFYFLDLNCPWKFEFLLVCILVIFIINPIWHGSGYIFIPLSLLDYILSVTGLRNRDLWRTCMIPNWLFMSPRDSLDHPGSIL